MFLDFANLPIFLPRCSSLWNVKVENRFLKFIVYKIDLFFIGYICLCTSVLAYATHLALVKDSVVGTH